MQKDFHYEVTYISARIAGFDELEAEAIAWAAQYVDDAISVDTKKIDLPSGKHHEFENILTAADLSVAHAFNPFQVEHAVKTVYSDKHRQIWAIYHFPPGNYIAYRAKGGKPRDGHILRQFRGKSNAQVIGQDVFEPLPQHVKLRSALASTKELSGKAEDRLTKEHFPLITRPNSDLVHAMIADTLATWKTLSTDEIGKGIALNLLGIRMHVFADSWAHQDHVGAPDRRFNRVESFGWFKKAGHWTQDKYEYIDAKSYEDASPGGTQRIASKSRSQVFWLGHGPMGTWPDLPWAVYRWRPRWSAKVLLRNNPEQFLQAFVNMTFVMKAVKEGSAAFIPQISPGAYRNVVGADNIRRFQDAISDMWKLGSLDKRESPDERAKIWRSRFDQYKPPKYDPNKAENEVLNAVEGIRGFRSYPLDDFLTTRYFRYHYAAKLHYQFMRNELRSQGFRVIFDDVARKAAMVDDYAVFQSEFKLQKKPQDDGLAVARDLVAKAIADLFRASSNERVQIGIQLLASDLENEKTPAAILTKLANIISIENSGQSAYKLFTVSAVKKRVLALRDSLQKQGWQEDSSASVCTSCGKSFGLVTRRHHCRQCLMVFCDACSNRRLELPHRGFTTKVRVCVTCFEKLKAR